MKPDWKDAPEWAAYVAQDADGIWYWYEEQPERNFSSGNWTNRSGTKYQQAFAFGPMEARP